MKKFKYKVHEIIGNRPTEKILNEFSKKGWKLITIIKDEAENITRDRYYIYLEKKKKQNKKSNKIKEKIFFIEKYEALKKTAVTRVEKESLTKAVSLGLRLLGYKPISKIRYTKEMIKIRKITNQKIIKIINKLGGYDNLNTKKSVLLAFKKILKD